MFNGTRAAGRGPLQLVREAKRAVSGAVRRVIAGLPAVPVERSAGGRNCLESALIGQFLCGVQIVPEKATRLVAIVYTSPGAEFAALAANTIAEEYAQQNLDLRLDAINKNLTWLGEEVVSRRRR